jgi:DNA-binding NtrC family response regulator
MSIPLPPLLVVDDERNMRLSLEAIMAEEGYEMRPAVSAEEALRMLEQEEFFMVITDARLTGMNGYDLLTKVKARWPDLPILMITAYATPKLAVGAIKAGAMDYLAKPFEPEELLHAVARCAERFRLLQENAALRARAGEVYKLERIIGESQRMVELRQLVQTVAPTNATALILGESGTGKELIAGAIHSLSQRSKANYVRLNCAAIPENLLESELFGHEKGAFTGAVKQKPGRVEEADGGTVFLDEIGDMSRPLQAKLPLPGRRFLHPGRRKPGAQGERPPDRATNRDIVEAIQNQFRRICFIGSTLCNFGRPVARAAEAIVLLADHFLRNFCLTLNKPGRLFRRGAESSCPTIGQATCGNSATRWSVRSF